MLDSKPDKNELDVVRQDLQRLAPKHDFEMLQVQMQNFRAESE